MLVFSFFIEACFLYETFNEAIIYNKQFHSNLMAFQEVGEESIKNSEHIDKTKINNRQVANEYPI